MILFEEYRKGEPFYWIIERADVINELHREIPERCSEYSSREKKTSFEQKEWEWWCCWTRLVFLLKSCLWNFDDILHSVKRTKGDLSGLEGKKRLKIVLLYDSTISNIVLFLFCRYLTMIFVILNSCWPVMWCKDCKHCCPSLNLPNV